MLIYSMNLDGSDRKKLNGDSSGGLNVIGNQIYYINMSDNDKLYSMKTDGSNRQKLSDDKIGWFSTIGSQIYYNNLSDNGTLYAMKGDGSEPPVDINAQVTSYGNQTTGNNPMPNSISANIPTSNDYSAISIEATANPGWNQLAIEEKVNISDTFSFYVVVAGSKWPEWPTLKLVAKHGELEQTIDLRVKDYSSHANGVVHYGYVPTATQQVPQTTGDWTFYVYALNAGKWEVLSGVTKTIRVIDPNSAAVNVAPSNSSSSSDYKVAYRGIVEESKNLIMLSDTPNVAFYDVTGDDIPEMFVRRAVSESEYNSDTSQNGLKRYGSYSAYLNDIKSKSDYESSWKDLTALSNKIDGVIMTDLTTTMGLPGSEMGNYRMHDKVYKYDEALQYLASGSVSQGETSEAQ